MIDKRTYKIISEYFIKKLDFNEVYNLSADISKRKFGKDIIIGSIRKMILQYPHFDTSIKNRIETSTSLFGVQYGIINNYIYILPSSLPISSGSMHLMNEKRLFEITNELNDYHLVINIKNVLRTIKIKKICKTI